MFSFNPPFPDSRNLSLDTYVNGLKKESEPQPQNEELKRERGLVECERHGNWVVYALPTKPSRELKANLACLQDCAREQAVFKRDLARLKKIEPACAWVRAGEPEKAPGQVRCGC